MEYDPPNTLIDTGRLMPVIVTGADVIGTDRRTSTWFSNENGSGFVSAGAPVVDVNVSHPVPPVSGVWRIEHAADAERCRTHTVWPLEMLPSLSVYVPLHPTE